MPVLGLLPVLVAAVLASEGRFGAPGGGGKAAGTPLASAPLTQGQATVGQPRPTQPAAEPTATRAPAESAGNTASTQAVAATPTAAVVSNAPSAVPNAPSAPSNASSAISNAQSTVSNGPDALGLTSWIDQLRVGQVLTIPNQTGWLYRIQPGETLNQIASRTGVPTEIIVSASMLSGELVQAGDVILIPEQRVTKSK